MFKDDEKEINLEEMLFYIYTKTNRKKYKIYKEENLISQNNNIYTEKLINKENNKSKPDMKKLIKKHFDNNINIQIIKQMLNIK